MKILVTGAAGFIGCFVAKSLLEQGHEVVGLDNINNYYDINLKYSRLQLLDKYENFIFIKQELADRTGMETLFETYQFDNIIHLAAQAGVRYSLKNPHVYMDSNITGFLHILEGARQQKVKHLVFASSSSVYGANTTMPYSVHHNVDHPYSLYAASKKANELMAHSYAHLYNIPCTGLRFFTVYGPWGRPDMAFFSFTQKIIAKAPIEIFNYGNHRRDFTYIDDIVEGVIHILAQPAQTNSNWNSNNPDPSSSKAPWRIYNIGNSKPIELMYYIELLEKNIGITAEKILLPMQPGDVPDTYADVDDLISEIGYQPKTTVEEGVAKFIAWYKEYYKVF